jgi:type II secretory pathway pseudopilin PulG
MAASRPAAGFSRIELLVIVAGLALFLAILIPSINSARESARRSQCRNNLKQIGLAFHNYRDCFGSLPFASTHGLPAEGTNGQHTWVEYIAPYIDASPFYSSLDFNLPNNSPALTHKGRNPKSELPPPESNRAAILAFRAPIYLCPSNPWAESKRCRDGSFFDGWDAPVQALCYPLCAGTIRPDGPTPDCPGDAPSFCITERETSWGDAHNHPHPAAFSRGVTDTKFDDFKDGLASTILAGERNPEDLRFAGAFSANFPVAFTAQRPNSRTRNLPNPNDFRANGGFSSHHAGGLQLLMADGAVRFLSNTIDHPLYCKMGDLADSSPPDPLPPSPLQTD